MLEYSLSPQICSCSCSFSFFTHMSSWSFAAATPCSASAKKLKQTTISIQRHSACKSTTNFTPKANMDSFNKAALKIGTGQQTSFPSCTMAATALQESLGSYSAESNLENQAPGSAKVAQSQIQSCLPGLQSLVASIQQTAGNQRESSRSISRSDCPKIAVNSMLEPEVKKRLRDESSSDTANVKRKMLKSTASVQRVQKNIPASKTEDTQTKVPLAKLDFANYVRTACSDSEYPFACHNNDCFSQISRCIGHCTNHLSFAEYMYTSACLEISNEYYEIPLVTLMSLLCNQTRWSR